MVGAARDIFGFNTKAVDGLVVKATLLNSARKIPGWTNNAENINGVYTTHWGLDIRTGAGALDLNRAYDQYLLGDTDLPGLAPGPIHKMGWDYGRVSGAPEIIDVVVDRARLIGKERREIENRACGVERWRLASHHHSVPPASGTQAPWPRILQRDRWRIRRGPRDLR